MTQQELNELKRAISEGLRNGFEDIERFNGRSNNSYRPSYRSSNYSNVDDKTRIERLERDLEAQRKETKNAAKLFGDFSSFKRDIEKQKSILEDSIKDYSDTVVKLKKILRDTTLSDAEAMRKAREEFNKLTKEIGELKSKLIDSGNFSEDIKKSIINAIKNIDFSKSSNDEILEILNKVAGKDFFTPGNIKDIKELAKNLKESEEIADGLAEAYGKGTIELKEQQRYLELTKNSMKEGIRTVEKGFGRIKKTVLDFADAWRKVDAASSKFVKNVGMGRNALVALRKDTINAVGRRGLGLKYNISMEELIGLQEGYSKAIGRNISMSSMDQENAAAMNYIMGEKGGKFAEALENFGMSYSDSARIAGKMFSDASKYGLNFEKYSENFLQNIKLAQNYTFKDGLKGLERMAKKATEIKLDMSQIASFADKVSTLEGAVQTSASLQVLGGAFAQFSDPLGMLYEGMADMEKLQERFQNITSKLVDFNKQTGQVEISAFDRQRIRAAASAMGMSYDQVMESIQAQGRRGYIEKELNRGGRGFSDEEREFLLNTATVNNGVAQMSFFDKNGKRVTRDVNKMTSAEIKQARAQNQTDSDNIRDIAMNVRSFNDKISGLTKTTEAFKAEIAEKPMNWLDKRLDGIHKYLEGIRYAVIGIAAAQAIGGLFNIGKGIFNTGSSARDFLRGARQAKISKLKLGKTASLAQKGGHALASLGGGSLVGGIATATGILASIAAVVYGIHGIVKTNEERKEHEGKVAQGLVKKGSKEDNEAILGLNKKTGKYGGLATGAAAGLAIGGVFGGPIGAAIGGVIGGTIGYFGGDKIGGYFGNKEIEKRKQEAIKENRLNSLLEEKGFKFNGGYTEEEYLKIIAAINRGSNGTISKADFSTLSEELRDKMIKSGDVSLFSELEEFAINEATIKTETTRLSTENLIIEGDLGKNKKGNGGLLTGPSHGNGGMPIIGSNIEVEGGEYVVNKNATKKYFGLLDGINKMGTGGVITPRTDNAIKPIAVMPVSDNSLSTGSNKPIDINMNINGTIKLDGGNGNTIDMNELLRDPVFVSKMTELIQKEIIYKTKGARLTTNL